MVLEFQSFCIFSCILTWFIKLIKPFRTKAYDSCVSDDYGTFCITDANAIQYSPGPKAKLKLRIGLYVKGCVIIGVGNLKLGKTVLYLFRAKISLGKFNVVYSK